MGGCIKVMKQRADGKSSKSAGANERKRQYAEGQDGGEESQVQAINNAEGAGPGAKKSWENEDRAAQRAAYRKLLFQKKQGEFLFRSPGELNGKDFAINYSNDCQLYVHDHIAQVFVDKCERSSIVIGPTKSSIFIRDCSNSKFTIFCQQLRMRDCHNLEVMLYSQTEVSSVLLDHSSICMLLSQPVVESSTNIKFIPMVYEYPELFSQMLPSRVSPWCNNWTDVFDFTPHQKAETGELNYYISPDLQPDFIRPLSQAKSLMDKVAQIRGEELKSLEEISPEDNEQATIEVAQEVQEALAQPPLFDLGDYFNNFSAKMLKTVPPTRQFQGKQIFKHSFFILCFVEDFDAIFDSVLLSQQGETDLSGTLFYKLMTICGSFLSLNEGKAKQVCWIEKTRSASVQNDEKQQLLDTI